MVTKKPIYLLLFIIVVVTGYGVYYFSEFNIKGNEADIQRNLITWLNRGDGKVINSTIIDIVHLDDTDSYVALFETNNENIGYAHIVKGWNGRFKLNVSGHGTNIVSYEEIKTNEGMYAILIGKNPDLEFDTIKAKLIGEDYSFTVDVSGEEEFIKYRKLPNDLNQTFPAELTFYDEEKNKIN